MRHGDENRARLVGGLGMGWPHVRGGIWQVRRAGVSDDVVGPTCAGASGQDTVFAAVVQNWPHACGGIWMREWGI